MSNGGSFLSYLYNLLMDNITLILCLLFVILVISVISNNLVLILVIVILLYMAFSAGRLNQSLMYGLRSRDNGDGRTAELFDGSEKRLYFNPVTSYGAVLTEQPMNYMYSHNGLGDPNNNPELMGKPGIWGNNLHIRMHATGAPVYVSNRPPTDVPSCQQVLCPPYINNLWTLKDIYHYSPSVNAYKLKCWKCIDNY